MDARQTAVIDASTRRTQPRARGSNTLKLRDIRHHHARPRRWFIHRELVVRSEGKSRTIGLTPRFQAAMVALIAAAGCASLVTAGTLARTHQETSARQSALFDQEARVTQEQQRLAAFHDDLQDTTIKLDRRQDFLERMVELLPAAETAALAPQPGATDGKLRRISAALPEVRGLMAIERRQLAAAAALTGFAEHRVERAEQAIRRLGLDPVRVRAAAQASAQNGPESGPENGMGGPLEALSSEADGSLDPRFERLGASLSRLSALEAGLERMPQVMPTALGRMTSNFGVRHDPFTGAAAMHSGLDFGGRMGEPIRAAAAGRVSFVGTKSGYGKVVEITHGNGLVTRYAHMSAWRASVGRAVEAGEVIGAIGSTGRSTGPHLHFEVRVNDRAVNPRPLLEGAPDVLEEMRSSLPTRD